MYTVWNSIKKKSRGKTQRQEISYPHVVRVIMTHLLLLEGEDKVVHEERNKEACKKANEKKEWEEGEEDNREIA
jgi:hypothetical protein